MARSSSPLVRGIGLAAAAAVLFGITAPLLKRASAGVGTFTMGSPGSTSGPVRLDGPGAADLALGRCPGSRLPVAGADERADARCMLASQATRPPRQAGR